jgi:DNA uptake protein ComE-like DNA-binding protein
MTLPGITETSAQKIIENRPYKAKADLTQKKVISSTLTQRLKLD